MPGRRSPRATSAISLQRIALRCLLVVLAGWTVAYADPTLTALAVKPFPVPPATAPGQVATLLPGGRWLLTGGEIASQPSSRIELRTGARAEAFPATLLQARRDHTATVLPTGEVLVFGGTGPDEQLVQGAELIDPVRGTVTAVLTPGLNVRMGHSATLLTNGKLLIAGGKDDEGNVLASAQLWDPRTGAALVESTLQIARFSQEAALLASGEGLLWGGAGRTGQPLSNGEVYNPDTNAFEGPVGPNDSRLLGMSAAATQSPNVVDTLPKSDDLDVALDSLLGIRFNKPLPIAQLDVTHIVLVGPSGAVAGTVVGAERGMLAFFRPAQELAPATTYTLFITGLSDEVGRDLPGTTVRFTTHRVVVPATATSPSALVGSKTTIPSATASNSQRSITSTLTETVQGNAAQTSQAQPIQDTPRSVEAAEDWIPQAANRHGAWRVLGLANDPPLSAPAAAPRTAGPNQTAIAGRVARVNGLPLAGVSVSLGARSTKTDAQGRFLLSGTPTGAQQLKVDGTGLIVSGRHYTQHYLRVNVTGGTTTVIPNPIYLPRVDPAMEVSISSPADHEIILTHPAIPGLEVHIPKGAVIREQDGKVVTKVSITPIPIDRAPYPTPVKFAAYFTLQPGGAYVDGDPSKAIQIIYPNYQGLAAGSTVNFWNYDPTAGGWQIYGHGKVSADGKQVLPDQSVGFRQIMSFGFAEGPNYVYPNTMPKTGPAQCTISTGGDPVDCATGLFLHNVTDIVERDVIPIGVTRMYRQNDNVQHAFGTGANLSYAMWLDWPQSCQGCSTAVTLVLGDGGQIKYYPVSGGGGNVYRNNDSPTVFQGSTLTVYQPPGGAKQWYITLGDGTQFLFENFVPYQLTSIADRNGNQVNITLEGNLITQVTSPNGRYLQFFYDADNHVNQVVDSLGRSAHYTYDSSGRLVSATDPDGNTESYGYDPVSGGMNLVTDKRGNAMVRNVFDGNGRVTQQTLADGAVWKFAYVLDNSGNVIQTTVTDPRNYVRQETFNTSGYLTQSVRAVGTLEQQTYVFQRDSTNEVYSVTDPMGRQTMVVYDTFGDPTSVTRLYGTANAVTYNYTYDPTYHQLTSFTDPLGHQTVIDHDAQGNVLSITDPLNDVTAIASNNQGLPIRVTDGLGHATQIGYRQGDLASITDALSRTSSVFTDAVGRLASVSDPLGNQTQYNYDAMDRITGVINALGEVTGATYDPNGNVLTVKDPRGVTHTFTYDSRNRRQTYQDPIGHSDSYVYDGMGNLTSHTDRKGQVTQISYDGINRPTLITYQDNSTIAISWDGGNRATQFVDSINGTITRQYDGLDHLKQETTPQGTVSYTYDNADRRSTMTVAGQAQVNYTFDNANRLTQIAQGALSVGYGYDAANRRTSITYPNGVVGTFTFDDANQLAGIAYAMGATQIGTLGYGYDAGGRRTSVTGTLAGFVPPAYVPSLTYDGANRLSSWNGTNLTYDNNGNLATFGSNTYTWNARNQLVATSAGGAAFSYDALGRRASAMVTGTTTAFLYDGWNPAAIAGNSVLAGPGLDDVQAIVSSSNATSLLRDGVNSTVALSDPNGATTATYNYSPYGDTATTGAGASALQYTGRENDGATGLYYYRNRYYSAQLGRFISEDPIGLGGGANFYAYVYGNPISYTDPLGLWGGFGFGSITVETPGPVRAAGEAIGLGGYDSNTGWYAGDIFAHGWEYGGHENYYAHFNGREVTTSSCGKYQGIDIKEVSVGAELPFVGGVGVGGGKYQLADGEWGIFFFIGGGEIFNHASVGVGFHL
jgi:RHS repeat-associated protein